MLNRIKSPVEGRFCVTKKSASTWQPREASCRVEWGPEIDENEQLHFDNIHFQSHAPFAVDKAHIHTRRVRCTAGAEANFCPRPPRKNRFFVFDRKKLTSDLVNPSITQLWIPLASSPLSPIPGFDNWAPLKRESLPYSWQCKQSSKAVQTFFLAFATLFPLEWGISGWNSPLPRRIPELIFVFKDEKSSISCFGEGRPALGWVTRLRISLSVQHRHQSSSTLSSEICGILKKSTRGQKSPTRPSSLHELFRKAPLG